MKVRLTRKLADQLDGIDVSSRREGDVFDLPRDHAQLLIAEHWAVPIQRAERRGLAQSANVHQRAVAADHSARRKVEQPSGARTGGRATISTGGKSPGSRSHPRGTARQSPKDGS
jgi:hypothetical protein